MASPGAGKTSVLVRTIKTLKEEFRISVMDTLAYFDFDPDACIARVRQLNPKIQIFPLSAVTGDGCAAWEDWLRDTVMR